MIVFHGIPTAVALTDHIRVRWQPPAQRNVMLRGYTLGWGRGVPDIYSKIVDSNKHNYIIDKLGTYSCQVNLSVCEIYIIYHSFKLHCSLLQGDYSFSFMMLSLQDL